MIAEKRREAPKKSAAPAAKTRTSQRKRKATQKALTSLEGTPHLSIAPVIKIAANAADDHLKTAPSITAQSPTVAGLIDSLMALGQNAVTAAVNAFRPSPRTKFEAVVPAPPTPVADGATDSATLVPIAPEPPAGSPPASRGRKRKAPREPEGAPTRQLPEREARKRPLVVQGELDLDREVTRERVRKLRAKRGLARLEDDRRRARERQKALRAARTPEQVEADRKRARERQKALRAARTPEQIEADRAAGRARTAAARAERSARAAALDRERARERQAIARAQKRGPRELLMLAGEADVVAEEGDPPTDFADGRYPRRQSAGRFRMR